MPLLPQGFDRHRRADEQSGDKKDRQPEPFSHRCVHFGGVDLGHQNPGRIRNGARYGENRHSAVVNAFDDSLLTEGRLHCRKLRAVKRHAQGQGRILAKLEFIEKDRLVSFLADQKRFCRLAGRRPALDEGVEIGVRIDPQHQHAEGTASGLLVDDGHEQANVDLPRMFIWIEIGKGRLPGSQSFAGILQRQRGERFAAVGNDHQRVGLGVEQRDPVVAVACLNVADPVSQRVLGGQVVRLMLMLPHQIGEGVVLMDDGGVGQTFLGHAEISLTFKSTTAASLCSASLRQLSSWLR